MVVLRARRCERCEGSDPIVLPRWSRFVCARCGRDTRTEVLAVAHPGMDARQLALTEFAAARGSRADLDDPGDVAWVARLTSALRKLQPLLQGIPAGSRAALRRSRLLFLVADPAPAVRRQPSRPATPAAPGAHEVGVAELATRYARTEREVRRALRRLGRGVGRGRRYAWPSGSPELRQVIAELDRYFPAG